MQGSGVLGRDKRLPVFLPSAGHPHQRNDALSSPAIEREGDKEGSYRRGGTDAMGTAENKRLVQDAIAAWTRGEGNAVFNLFADDGHCTGVGRTDVSRTSLS